MKTLKTLINIIALALVVALAIPPAYYAWRAGQPMRMPEFNGLTFHQFVEWQNASWAEREERYNIPDDKRGICELTDDIFANPARMGLANLYALSGMFPGLKNVLAPADWDILPEPGSVNVLNFPAAAWDLYEVLILNGSRYQPHTSLIQCRISGEPPTLEEYEALMARHRQATGSQ